MHFEELHSLIKGQKLAHYLHEVLDVDLSLLWASELPILSRI